MTEGELRRTALAIPPRGRAVLCVWCAIPGLLAAPFLFWRGVAVGCVFCLLWAALTAFIWVRACSFVAVLDAQALTVYVGVTFPVRRTLPRQVLTGTHRFRSPLLGLAGVVWVELFAPGVRLVLPAVDVQQADALLAALSQRREGGPCP